ncbi:MAG: kelch repeat-containing protein [Pseudomonadota bacterium]
MPVFHPHLSFGLPGLASRLSIWLALLFCGAAARAAEGLWEAAPAMQHARAAHAVVGTGDGIYALAGTRDGGKAVLEVERFDGKLWQLETRMPGAGLNAPAAAALDGRIYLIGGFNTNTNVPTTQVLVYDTRTRQWSAGAPLPAPRGGHAAVVLDGVIHVLGGGNSMATIADHSSYDPVDNTWRALAPLPRAEGSPAAVVYGGKLYAIGGRSGAADFGDVYLYDAAKDTWSSGPGIEPRGTAGAVAYCGAIYLFGGESQARQQTLDSVLTLRSPASSWEPAPAMPTARSFARAVLFGGAVYVVGGSPSYGNSHGASGSAATERFYKGCGS